LLKSGNSLPLVRFCFGRISGFFGVQREQSERGLRAVEKLWKSPILVICKRNIGRLKMGTNCAQVSSAGVFCFFANFVIFFFLFSRASPSLQRKKISPKFRPPCGASVFLRFFFKEVRLSSCFFKTLPSREVLKKNRKKSKKTKPTLTDQKKGL